MDFDIMLFDELMLVFDLEMVGEVLGVMKELVKGGMMMMIVIYEMGFVCEVGDWVIFMDGGYIVEEGKLVDIFDNLINERMISFLDKVL